MKLWKKHRSWIGFNNGLVDAKRIEHASLGEPKDGLIELRITAFSGACLRSTLPEEDARKTIDFLRGIVDG